MEKKEVDDANIIIIGSVPKEGQLAGSDIRCVEKHSFPHLHQSHDVEDVLQEAQSGTIEPIEKQSFGVLKEGQLAGSDIRCVEKQSFPHLHQSHDVEDVLQEAQSGTIEPIEKQSFGVLKEGQLAGSDIRCVEKHSFPHLHQSHNVENVLQEAQSGTIEPFEKQSFGILKEGQLAGSQSNFQSVENESFPHLHRSHDVEDVLQEAQSVTKKTKKPKPHINWIQQHSFTIDNDQWTKIHTADKLNTGEYVSVFCRAINSFEDMPCVLRSNGYHISYQKFVLRFQCVQCDREYEVRQIDNNNFMVSHNGATIIHTDKVTRQLRGFEREAVKDALLKAYPKAYKKSTEKTMNRDLYKAGNLQDVKSMETLRRVRHEALQSFDYDNDDIFDLLKMKIIADQNADKHGSDIYIRRISLDPFTITCIPKSQFHCLKKLAESTDEITVYFDATGGLVRHGAKRIYYYAGVTPFHLPNETTAKVLPVIQFISGAHDAFNIGIPLQEYKNEFHKQFPTLPWPIKYAVTDFSFASLNALCHSWNRMDLIDYINRIYEHLTAEIDITALRINTFLQLCCGHYSKTFAKDVDLYFPQLGSAKQAVLQEIFAGMCNSLELNSLQKTWTYLSTILLSKSVTEDVTKALEQLAYIMVKPDELDESNAIPEEDKLPKIDEDDAMYKQSKFYQNFKSITFTEKFPPEQGPSNGFYSIEFADVMLKKYISILCLWTCLTQKKRKANTYVEGHFKVTKQHIITNVLTLGTPPLKCGRFIREMEAHSKEETEAILLQIPSERLCRKQAKQSQGAIPKTPRTFKQTTLLSIYKTPPTTPTSSQIIQLTPTSEIINVETTPKSSRIRKNLNHIVEEVEDDVEHDPMKIDDPNVEESWARKPKSKHSFFQQKTLKKISTSHSATQLAKILEAAPNKQTKLRNRKKTLRNGLISNPAIYLAPSLDIAVATIGKLILHQRSYKLLEMNNFLENNLINFVFSIFRLDYKHIQFEVDKTQLIISDQNVQIFNITKDIFIGSLLQHNQYSILIIDSKQQLFSYIDPTAVNPPLIQRYFENFLQFVETHNEKFTKKPIPSTGWTIKTYDYPIQNDIRDTGVFILHFTYQFLSSKLKQFNAFDYRLELQHLILRKSTNMKNKCIVCGFFLPPGHDKIDWVACNACNRWTHMICIGMKIEGSDDKDKNYFCVICQANTPDTNLSKSVVT